VGFFIGRHFLFLVEGFWGVYWDTSICILFVFGVFGEKSVKSLGGFYTFPFFIFVFGG